MSVLDTFKFATIDSKPKISDRLPSIRGFFSGAEVKKYIENKNDMYQTSRSARPGIPSFDFSPSYTNRLWFSQCYWYEDEVSILSDVLQKMRSEVIRYGFRWKPAFAKRCKVCGTEYKEVVKKCEICGSEELLKPDRMQLRQARVGSHHTILEVANINEQSLQDVIKQLLFHTLVTDNGYIYAHKEYHWDEEGNLISAFPREYLALDPRDVIKLFDFETGFPGKGRVCLDHRSSLLGEKDETCPQCGKKTYRAFYQVFTATKTSTYYIKDEIRHLPFYYPSIIYGFPVAFKIKDELIAYHMIEKRVRNYYEFCKVPGILFVPTDNPEGLKEMWKKTREETKDDPHTPALIGIDKNAPTNANFIKLMEDPNQNLISVKEDLRDRIASSFGITMAFTNDTSQTGGLKNDKNLISLSDRTIRSLQKFIDNKVFTWITLSMGITDWILECEPNINENKLEEEEVIANKLSNMEKFTQLGIPVEWKDDDYIVSETPDEDKDGVPGTTGGMNPMMGGPSGPGGPGAPGGMPPMGGGMPMGGPPMGNAPPMAPPAQQEEEEEPMEVGNDNFFADAALGRTPASGKKVKSELSNMLEELFHPEKVAAEKKKKAEKEAQKQQQQMASMMPPPPDDGAMQ